MLDIKRIRQNPEALVEAMRKRRNKGADVTALLELDAKRREVMQEVEQLKAKRNEGSAKVPAMKKAGEDTTALMAEMKELGARVKELDDQIAKMDEELQSMLMSVPNIPHESVPEGADDKANVEVRRWSEPTKFDFEPKAHWDIGENLDILDFATAGKITGARFTVYKGLGSRLERAIINYYLDTHTANGYTEIFPPYMVNRASMTGTGQLPKFEEDAFKVANTDYFLIPTAEVPVTNMLRGEIVEGDRLPIKYCAYSACFRSEAGSAGRDTRGLIRQHQFNKVELVKFTKPEDSYDELESLTRDAEKVLQGLGLPYHVVVLSDGRPWLLQRQDLRHRGMDAQLRQVCGDKLLLQLRGFPGPPRPDTLPPGKGRQAGACAHPQRLRRSRRPHRRRHTGELPAARRHREGTRCAGKVHGLRIYRKVNISLKWPLATLASLFQVLPLAYAPGRQNPQSTKTSGFSSVLTHMSSKPE